jgi:hypothetical protein
LEGELGWLGFSLEGLGFRVWGLGFSVWRFWEDAVAVTGAGVTGWGVMEEQGAGVGAGDEEALKKCVVGGGGIDLESLSARGESDGRFVRGGGERSLFGFLNAEAGPIRCRVARPSNQEEEEEDEKEAWEGV